MTVYIGFTVFLILYLLSKYFCNQKDKSIKKTIWQFLRRVSLLGAIIGGLFSLAQLWILGAGATSAVSKTLLHIENVLALSKKYLSVFTGSPTLLIGSLILLIVLILLPSLTRANRVAKLFATTASSVAKIHTFLVAITALTFFGTGTGIGVAELEAKLVEDKKEFARGVDDAQKAAKSVAESIVEDALVVRLKEELEEDLNQAQDLDDLEDEYPLLWSKIAAVNEGLSEARRARYVDGCCDPPPGGESLVLEIIEKAKKGDGFAVNAALKRVLAGISKSLSKLQTDPVLSQKLVTPEAVAGSNLIRINELTASLELQKADRKLLSAKASLTEVTNETLKLAAALTYNQTAEKIVSSAIDSTTPTAISDLLGIFVDESLHEPVKELVSRITSEIVVGSLGKGGKLNDALNKTREIAKSAMGRIFSNPLKQNLKSKVAALNEGNANFKGAIKLSDQKLKAASEALLKRQSEESLARVMSHSETILNNPYTEIEAKEIIQGLSQSLQNSTGQELVNIQKSLQKTLSRYGGTNNIDSQLNMLNEIARTVDVSHDLKYAVDYAVSDVLSVEYQGAWGDVRYQLEDAVDNRLMRISESKKDNAEKAMAMWRTERRKIGLQAAFSKGAQVSLSSDEFEKRYAKFLTKSPQMTALWGFGVIALYEDQTELDRIVKEYAPKGADKLLAEYEWLKTPEKAAKELSKNTGESTFSILARHGALDGDTFITEPAFLDSPSKKILIEYVISNGAKPMQGYELYQSRVGIQNIKDTLRWSRSNAVGDAIEKICPF